MLNLAPVFAFTLLLTTAFSPLAAPPPVTDSALDETAFEVCVEAVAAGDCQEAFEDASIWFVTVLVGCGSSHLGACGVALLGFAEATGDLAEACNVQMPPGSSYDEITGEVCFSEGQCYKGRVLN